MIRIFQITKEKAIFPFLYALEKKYTKLCFDLYDTLQKESVNRLPNIENETQITSFGQDNSRL